MSTDDRHRYAPFLAASNDTQKSVRGRIVAYYDNLLFRRAQPATHYGWHRAPKPDAAPTPTPEAAPE